ncbi:unnamed protein product [marine sediment metagenome]|uniref:Uncharacterized protein n=1 Tax=marine sediment metagenome TaxID=412755 RepID=X1SSI3_9ZZZZ
MANDYKYYVDWFKHDCESCQSDLSLARADYDDIDPMAFPTVGGHRATISAIKGAIDGLIDAVYHLISHEAGQPFYYNAYNALKENCDYLDECGGAVTWQAICEAWVKDDFAGMEWTIACIDHMRKLMWDKPFSVIWASAPTEYEIK